MTGLERGTEYLFRVEALDAAGHESTGGPTAVHMPLPVLVVPPLDRTVATNLPDSTSFLYTGADPVQWGVAPGTIERRRASLLTGRVLDTAGDPLPGVRVRVFARAELGTTMSREDGRWEMVVNGGGRLTVRYDRAGYGTVDRAEDVSWIEYVGLPDVVMTALDSAVTTVDLSAPGMRVARANPVTDSDGTRRPTVLIPHGAQATVPLPGGGSTPISTVSLRLTEYTVGERGEDAMPAELPPTTAYTHATEFTADEALALGSTEVDWDRDVLYYLENFLGYPVGGGVPLGFYDRDTARWVASDSGRIVEIVGIDAGRADVDVDGDGVADTGSALSDLGITDAERETLATLYPIGQELWRSPIRHFSVWDCNWAFEPPEDADFCQCSLPPEEPTQCQESIPGSRVECETQTLAEDVGLVGAPGLHHRADTTVGWNAERRLRIAFRHPMQDPPESLKEIRLAVIVAGQRHGVVLGRAAASFEVLWDGLDRWGRAMQGTQRAEIIVDWVYDAVPVDPDRFGRWGYRYAEGGRVILGDTTRREIVFRTTFEGRVRQWDGRALGLGGWSIDGVHLLDSGQGGEEILLGSGQRRRAQSIPQQVHVLAGNGSPGSTGNGGLARQAQVQGTGQMAVAADGTIVFAEPSYHVVRRIRPDGVIELVAGTGVPGYSGDGGPATSAALRNPDGVAVAADGTVYIADRSNMVVRRVDPTGTITTVAGTGEDAGQPQSSDVQEDGPALTIRLDRPSRLLLGPDGSLFVSSARMVRRLTSDGLSERVAGCALGLCPTCSPESCSPAVGLEQGMVFPSATAIDRQGNLYLTFASALWRLHADGALEHLGGAVQLGAYPGDGFALEDIGLGSPENVVLSPNGDVLIASSSAARVLRVQSDGLVSTAAGGGTTAPYDGANPRDTQIMPSVIALAPDGSLIVGTSGYLLRVGPTLPGLSNAAETVVASESGDALYVFDAGGRHLRTLDAWTGSLLREMTYDSEHRLMTIGDLDGNVTTIERDGSGGPTAVVGPFGQRTTLTLDGDGYVASIASPAAEVHQLTYGPTGLLSSMRDPRGSLYQFGYDGQGRLLTDEDPAGGGWTLARSDHPGGFQYGSVVTLTSAEGRTRVQSRERAYRGLVTRTTVGTDGLVDRLEIRDDGSVTSTSPDGTRATTRSEGDRRLGTASPQARFAEVRLPSGLTSTVSSSRSAALATPGDPLSLTAYAESTTTPVGTTSTTYQPAIRRWATTSPAGRQSVATLDARGRPSFARFANLASATVQFDARGRLDAISIGDHPDTRETTFLYDALGRLQTVTDPLSRSVSFAYDAANRVTEQTLIDGRVVGYAYDDNGNVTSITPPGRPAHGLAYTPVDLAESYAPPPLPGVGNTILAYNLDRQVELITRHDGTTIDPVYDAAGRLDHTVTPEGIYDHTYSPISGHLETTSSPLGTSLAFSYDGSLPIATTFGGPVAGTVSRVHDSSFRTREIRLNGNLVADYDYDADSLVTRAGAMTLTPDFANGLLTATTIGNVTTTHEHNRFAETLLTRARYLGLTIHEIIYERDSVGRITRKTETLPGSNHIYDYRYDAAGRLHEVDTDGALSARYTYDANSNRTGALRGGIPTTGTVDAQDRLTEWGTQVFTYTPNGELASRLDTATTALTQYGYDSSGALRTVALPSGDAIEYVLDPAGRRIGKRVNGVLEQAWLYQDGLRPSRSSTAWATW
ncbi:MAG: hypothetical protein IT379_25405 [Deltaproteobacteria bacterium]|nr:hypothetical protein [Deltaproteobacteria bacterium]